MSGGNVLQRLAFLAKELSASFIHCSKTTGFVVQYHCEPFKSEKMLRRRTDGLIWVLSNVSESLCSLRISTPSLPSRLFAATKKRGCCVASSECMERGKRPTPLHTKICTDSVDIDSSKNVYLFQRPPIYQHLGMLITQRVKMPNKKNNNNISINSSYHDGIASSLKRILYMNDYSCVCLFVITL